MLHHLKNCLIFSFILFSSTILSAQGEKPNFVFIIADDLYPEMFNALPEGKGKNLTPNIDRLVKEGIFFDNQYASTSVCTPSRFSCLTGLYASRSRSIEFEKTTQKNDGETVVLWNTHITPDTVTLPSTLRQHGYRTAMVGKNHVIRNYNKLPFHYHDSVEDLKKTGFFERLVFCF